MPLLGTLAGAPMTLAPSLRGIGPNTYLAMSHFWAMLGAAMIVHLFVLAVYSMLPEEKVTAIPVRALSFKLGPQENMAAYGLQMALERTLPAETAAPQPVAEANPVPAPVSPAAVRANEWRAAPVLPKTAPKTVKIPQEKSVPEPERRQRPAENLATQVPQPQTLLVPPPAATQQPAIAPAPQRYVRETGLPSLTPITGGEGRGYTGLGTQYGSMGGSGTQTVLNKQQVDAARLRYTQQISAWVERHIYYPAEAKGDSGRVIVRIRLDRQGYLRYFAIERSSGNAYFDRTAIDVVRRADPFPAPSPDYPSENLNEFTFPVDFAPPR